MKSEIPLSMGAFPPSRRSRLIRCFDKQFRNGFNAVHYEVLVSLKKEVLDPEGRAIQETLGRLGFRALKGVQVAKRYVLDIEDQGGAGQELAERIAREYLANPVAETFEVRKL
jgi:phosphoribosylformylglycinamidine synthase